jgi:hypothetical protein
VFIFHILFVSIKSFQFDNWIFIQGSQHSEERGVNIVRKGSQHSEEERGSQHSEEREAT